MGLGRCGYLSTFTRVFRVQGYRCLKEKQRVAPGPAGCAGLEFTVCYVTA